MGAHDGDKGMLSPSLVTVASLGGVLVSTLFAAADGSPALVSVTPVTGSPVSALIAAADGSPALVSIAPVSGSPVSAVIAAADGSPALVAVAPDAGSFVAAEASPYPVGVRVGSLRWAGAASCPCVLIGNVAYWGSHRGLEMARGPGTTVGLEDPAQGVSGGRRGLRCRRCRTRTVAMGEIVVDEASPSGHVNDISGMNATAGSSPPLASPQAPLLSSEPAAMDASRTDTCNTDW